MYELHLTGLASSPLELSRQAADRHTLLSAVKERRAQQRRSALSVRPTSPAPRVVAPATVR